MWHHNISNLVIYFPSNQLAVKALTLLLWHKQEKNAQLCLFVQMSNCFFIKQWFTNPLQASSLLPLSKHIAVDFRVTKLHKPMQKCSAGPEVSWRHFLPVSSFTVHLIQQALQLLPSSPWTTWWIMQVSDFWLPGSHKDQGGDFCLRQVISVAPSLYLSLLNDFTS